ncbi:hypothetical protein [Bosea sp. CS1GBMeth4]|uniref:hypothetical protein n=1 Tax=Bosea sp. CS1GBMeth4 TaxID=1892849 RepID=UPI0016448F9E|nr:hypothetical protein [Bosea sp. CS1GBMeth4]
MTAAQYTFHLAGFTPETLPMARLADYLSDLAQLLGSKEHVHLDRIQAGSIELAVAVDQEARPLVGPRVRSAALGEGPNDALAAWLRLNERLGKDGASATLKLPGGEVIPFPGAAPLSKPIGPLRQETTIQGRLVRLQGNGDDVSVGLDDEEGLIGRIVVRAELARELGNHFHRHVRLSGRGRWRRNAEGQWCLEHLDVAGFVPLDDKPLDDVLRHAGSLLPEGSAQKAIDLIHELRRA